jgi:hypothetical protein
LCRLLLVAFALKLIVLGMLIVETSTPGWSLPFAHFFSGKDASGHGMGPGVAIAATQEGAAAPPAVEATLPDAGMERAVPGRPGGSGASGASSGTPSSLDGADADRALPAIAAPAPTPPQGISQNDVRDSLARRQEDLSRKEQDLRVLESDLASRLEKM